MISKLRTKIRKLIKDTEQSTSYSEAYTISNIFTLPENASSVTKVTVDGSETQNYTFDSDSNTVTISDSLSSGNNITIYYKYTQYTNSELEEYIANSLVWLNIYDYAYELESGDSIYPIPPLRLQNLICVIAYILIKPNFSQYNLPNVTQRFPRNFSKEEKIRRVVQNYKMGGVKFGIIQRNG